jgi:hypothetical protein
VISCVPKATFVGSYSTEQLLDCSVPANGLNSHVVEGLKVPSESEPKLTVPVGVDGVPAAVSVTVAVHVAGCETTTPEPQLTETVVPRGPAARAGEHATDAQPTATAMTARRSRRQPPRHGRRSPSSTTESTFRRPWHDDDSRPGLTLLFAAIGDPGSRGRFKTSAGALHPSVLRGRLGSVVATAARSAVVCLARSGTLWEVPPQQAVCVLVAAA